MTPHDYQIELEKHDWYYVFSGDARIWQKGKDNEDTLKSLATTPELKELYAKEFKKHFNNHQ